jgi:hypothetical protein
MLSAMASTTAADTIARRGRSLCADEVSSVTPYFTEHEAAMASRVCKTWMNGVHNGHCAGYEYAYMRNTCNAIASSPLARHVSRVVVYDLRADGLVEFMHFARRLVNLRTLVCDLIHVPDAGVQALCEFVGASTSIDEFEFEFGFGFDRSVSSSNVPAFARTVASLVSFAIKRMNADMSSIFDSFGPGMARVALYDCNAGPGGMASLARACVRSPALTSVRLVTRCRNEKGTWACADIAPALATLHSVSFNSCGVDSACVRELESAIRNSATLTSLSLCNDRIDNIGVLALARAVRHSTSITTLELSSIGAIEYDGVHTIALAAAKCPSMTSLNLNDSPIGDRGAVWIAMFAVPKLVHLSLNGCEIRSRGIRQLANSVRRGSTLKSLCIAGNYFTSEEAMYVIEVSGTRGVESVDVRNTHYVLNPHTIKRIEQHSKMRIQHIFKRVRTIMDFICDSL